MDSTNEDFATNFYNLTGTTIRERKKCFRALLNETQSPVNLSNLQPRTPLEEIFKIDALLHFQQHGVLFEVLKEGNPIVTERILREASFIDYLSKNVNGEALVEFYLHVSYNTKLKLMNKLSLHLRNADRGDEYFSCVKQAYGLYLASKLLPACSLDVILDHLSRYRIEVTPRYLLRIIKKYPSSTESVIDKLHRQSTSANFAKKYMYVFKYLFKNDEKLYSKLAEKYNVVITMGRRTTSTFLTERKQLAIDNPRKYYNLLHKKRIGRSLKEDFVSFYEQILPKSVNDFVSNFQKYFVLLKHIRSKPHRLRVLLDAFEKVYDCDFWQFEALITVELLKMMTVDDRVLWMQTHHKPKTFEDHTWITFLKTEDSLPKLKKLISFTFNIKLRTSLVSSLVETCRINCDKLALLDVLNYVVGNHRNDHPSIFQKFVTTLYGSFRLSELDQSHWDVINDFTIPSDNRWLNISIKEQYVYYCLDKGLSVDELLVSLLKSGFNQYSICEKKPAYQKICLQTFMKSLPAVYQSEELHKKHYDCLESFLKWNGRYPNDKLPSCLDDTTYEAIALRSETNYVSTPITSHLILAHFSEERAQTLLELLIKRQRISSFDKVSIWLLKYHPHFFKKNLDTIMLHLKASCWTVKPIFIHLSRYYTHLEIPEKMSEFCSSLDCSSWISNLLVYISKPDQFLNEIPMKLDVRDWKNYKLQQIMLPQLRKLLPHSLDHILHFCRSGYLQNIQRSLYSACYNLGELKLIPFLRELNNRPVSIRKHAIFLAFKVFNLKFSYDSLENSVRVETHPVVTKSLFKAAFNMFLRNCDGKAWDLMVECLKITDEKDVEIVKIFTKSKRVMRDYFVQYMLYVWDFVENYPSTGKVVELGKCDVLTAVTSELITLLPENFCTRLIRRYFLKPSTFGEVVTKFTCLYVIHYDSKFLAVICEMVADCLKEQWKDVNCQNLIYQFVKEFCAQCKAGNHLGMLQLFSDTWNSFLKPHEAYNEFLYLRLTIILVNTTKGDLIEIGKSLGQLCQLLNDCHCFIPHEICKSYELFKTEFLNNSEKDSIEESELVLLDSVLSDNIVSCLFVVLALPHIKLMSSRVESLHDSIIRKLRNCTNPILQVHLHNYFKNENFDNNRKSFCEYCADYI
ncbi:hypothetical protein RI129_008107 [Pyrocoelia pectoralis]|uniref:Uncharacterized protein n=1 Tax=Pyrocoelia pectoralis TaxID=417401 RepID=A0AAN7VAX0_9COLE